MKTIYLLSFLLLFVLAPLTWGQIPHTLSYQGILTDDSDVPVPDGNYNVTFRLYEVATEGTSIWEEAQLIAVANGVFHVILGSVVPIDLPFDNQYWLGITVGGGSELTPRLQLTSSAYSLNAANSENTGGYPVSSTPSPNTLLPLDENSKLPVEVLPPSKLVKVGGINSGESNTITGTTNLQILSLQIPDEGQFDVILSAHLVAEISGDGTGRYDFNITRGDGGPSVGRGWWRPGTSAGLYAVTINFNGFDADVSGPVTYYLVGKKFDAGAKDALVFISGLNATWVEK